MLRFLVDILVVFLLIHYSERSSSSSFEPLNNKLTLNKIIKRFFLSRLFKQPMINRKDEHNKTSTKRLLHLLKLNNNYQ